MTDSIASSAALLKAWDERESAALEGELRLASNGHRLVVVSDLHVAEGRQEDDTYRGTENFFSDDAFGRFLRHLSAEARAGESMLLIINGDFVDFMRITLLPVTEGDFQAWSNLLAAIGIQRSTIELRASIYKKEREFGLGTDPDKSVWKLAKASAGHRELFTALGEWLASGHRLAVVSGNHDLEWYWREVRDYLRLLLASLAPGEIATNLGSFLRRIFFSHHALLVDEQYYFEHGHRFDRFTSVVGPPVLKGTRSLNLPFGSFFNRYLINRIEFSYPYVDNVRPQPAMLPFLVRRSFPLALKLLLYHLPFAVHVIPKRYFRYLFERAFWFALAIGVPVALMLVGVWRELALVASHAQAPIQPGVGGLVRQAMGGVVQNSLWLVGSYFLSQLVAVLQLKEPSSLDVPAGELLSLHPQWRLITMGHTHNPSAVYARKQQYLNSSTWINVVETSSGELRLDCAYLFVLLDPAAAGSSLPARLLRWNDEADRIEPAAVVMRRR
jgi:UDP-2,3-diacylglucosamine pyrophosphatase LpxH